MCDCHFCTSSAQDILACINLPLSLVGRCKTDNTVRNMLVFGDPTKSKVFVGGNECVSLLDACHQFEISPDSIYMKDRIAGILRFDTVVNTKWDRESPPFGKLRENTIKNCTANHKPTSTDTLTRIVPQLKKRLRAEDADQLADANREQRREFDPLSSPSHMWTEEKLMTYMCECPIALTNCFPVLLRILDEYVRLHRTLIYCEFAIADGTTVKLWMPHPIVHINASYLKVWQSFAREKESADTSWDDWDTLNP